jgi:hypothetical protein
MQNVQVPKRSQQPVVIEQESEPVERERKYPASYMPKQAKKTRPVRGGQSLQHAIQEDQKENQFVQEHEQLYDDGIQNIQIDNF